MTTKILASSLSPFSARLRIACALKQLDIPFEPAPGGTGSPELKSINPFGQIPVLQTDGAVLVESLALLDYLEDAYPHARSLRFADPLLAARTRMIGHLFDNKVMRAVQGLFAQLLAPKPDPAAAQQALDDATTELEKLATFLDAQGPAVGGKLSTADCAMAPFAWLFAQLAPMFGATSPFSRVPRFAAWWQELSVLPEVAGVTDGMQQALNAMMAARRAQAGA